MLGAMKQEWYDAQTSVSANAHWIETFDGVSSYNGSYFVPIATVNDGTYIYAVGANGGQMPDKTVQSTDKQNKSQGVKKCPEISRDGNRGAGQVISTPPTNAHGDILGPNATPVNAAANSRQLELDAVFVMDDGIMADMTIVGDPTFPTQADGTIMNKTVAIAFINPFHLMPNNSKCGDWLAKPPCNELLSDKNWQIEKVNHRIEGGTYTTTLSLRLTAPGFDTLISNPVGDSTDGETIS